MVAHLVSRMEAWDNRNTQVGDLFLQMVTIAKFLIVTLNYWSIKYVTAGRTLKMV